jgi:hypothetical protein
VVTVALEREVCCRGGLEVRSQVTVAECPPLDLLVVPGGPGTRASGARLDELAAAAPVRDVLVVSIYRPGARRLPGTLAELRRTRHSLRVALGAMGEPDAGLAAETVATRLAGGKFANVNAVLAATGEADWTLVVDDDVVLPRRFLDRFLGVCESLELALAQPAQSLASHAAWPVTRRRAGSLARETRFVEIGPVTCFRRDVLAALRPFPELRFGWGLDLHWAAVAGERGWRLGIVDALPVRHEHAAVAGTYSSRDAIEEARAFLAERPFVDSTTASEPLRMHPLR